MLTSVAGPLSNILLAFVSVFPLEVTIITNYEYSCRNRLFPSTCINS